MRAVTASANSNHTSVQNLKGWSFRGDSSLVINLRAGAVGGQILVTFAGDSTEILNGNLDAAGGTYVEVVSGTITVGVLYEG